MYKTTTMVSVAEKVRVRAKISVRDKNTLVIHEIPYSTTTSSLIDSILKANDKGKIKIKKIEDNTAAEVEILVHLPMVFHQTKQSMPFMHLQLMNLFSPLGCIIIDNKPKFIGVSEMLKNLYRHHCKHLKKGIKEYRPRT